MLVTRDRSDHSPGSSTSRGIQRQRASQQPDASASQGRYRTSLAIFEVAHFVAAKRHSRIVRGFSPWNQAHPFRKSPGGAAEKWRPFAVDPFGAATRNLLRIQRLKPLAIRPCPFGTDTRNFKTCASGCSHSSTIHTLDLFATCVGRMYAGHRHNAFAIVDRITPCPKKSRD